MGREKERLMEEDEQGWQYSERAICAECVDEPGLLELIEDAVASFECDFCGRKSADEPIAAPFDVIMEPVGKVVHEYFDRAEETLSHDNESESGYFGTTYDTYELFDTLPPPSEDEDVMAAVIESLGHHVWSDRRPFSTTGVELYEVSWQSFCDAVKYDTRFFFGSRTYDPLGQGEIPVAEMLAFVLEIVDEAGLVQELPEGAHYHRTRPHKAKDLYATWDQLGSPPKEKATANRMSAAGISVFYASTEMETAAAEVLANLREIGETADASDTVTSATWSTTRPLICIDLTRLLTPQSVYRVGRDAHDRRLFLQYFIENITQPVSHDGREHIDYVPTQVFTEYIRHEYSSVAQPRVDGIVYRSAQRPGGTNIVVFASSGDLNPDSLRVPQKRPLLVLDEASVRRWRIARDWRLEVEAGQINNEKPG